MPYCRCAHPPSRQAQPARDELTGCGRARQGLCSRLSIQRRALTACDPPACDLPLVRLELAKRWETRWWVHQRHPREVAGNPEATNEETASGSAARAGGEPGLIPASSDPTKLERSQRRNRSLRYRTHTRQLDRYDHGQRRPRRVIEILSRPRRAIRQTCQLSGTIRHCSPRDNAATSRSGGQPCRQT